MKIQSELSGEARANYEIEKNRIIQILDNVGISDNRKTLLEPVIENTAWMKIKLDDTRDKIKNSSVVIPYDNGGGQTGIRENPLFKGYESLWKSYLTGMNMILSCLPEEVIEEEIIEQPKTILELVRGKHA